jgi:Protein of unknown function (DUF3105)
MMWLPDLRTEGVPAPRSASAEVTFAESVALAQGPLNRESRHEERCLVMLRNVAPMSGSDQDARRASAADPRSLEPRATLKPETGRKGRSLRKKVAIGFATFVGLAILLVVGFSFLGAVTGTHTLRSVTYAEIPPHSGDHSPVWQRCGFYSEPVGNEHAVHSLEHGAVWITYQPNLTPDQVDVLRAMARAEDKLLVSPFIGLPAPIVVASWGQQVRLDSAKDPQLDASVRDFLNNPQAPEPDGGCDGPNLLLTGAVGNPEP